MCKLEACVDEIRTWLSENHLRLNDEKTEFILIGQKQLLKKIDGDKSIRIGDSVIKAAPHAKNIGAMIDAHLDMKNHVNYIARSSYLHMRNIGHIRPNLTEDATSTLVHAFISSKIDNMNGLLYGLPECVIKKLQLIQNNAARLVKRKKKCDHVTPIMKEESSIERRVLETKPPSWNITSLPGLPF